MNDIQINQNDLEVREDENQDRKKKPNKVFFKIAITCIIVGFGLWIPNLAFQYSFAGWMLTFPLGIIGLACALKSHRNKILLIILSICVSISFFIVMAGGYALAAYCDKQIQEENIIDITAPEYTEAINVEGEVYDLISSKTEEAVYIYFGQPNCADCKKFEDILSPILSKKSITVFYYDIEGMPRKEADDMLDKLNIDSTPYLAKIQKGIVIDKVTAADIDKIEEFLN